MPQASPIVKAIGRAGEGVDSVVMRGIVANRRTGSPIIETHR
jgi:hypothetical protein